MSNVLRALYNSVDLKKRVKAKKWQEYDEFLEKVRVYIHESCKEWAFDIEMNNTKFFNR